MPPPIRSSPAAYYAEVLARIRGHIANDVPEAIKQLGDIYLDGELGLPKSAKKAVKLYKRAVELGDVEAMHNLALIYDQGRYDGIKQDPQKAMQLFRMAADRGEPQSQYNLGVRLWERRANRGWPRATGLGWLGRAGFAVLGWLDNQGLQK